MKYVLQDMHMTRSFEAPAFVSADMKDGVTRNSTDAARYSREDAIDIQNRSRGRYRALPETAPIVQINN
jgi:hypothetical protein